MRTYLASLNARTITRRGLLVVCIRIVCDPFAVRLYLPHLSILQSLQECEHLYMNICKFSELSRFKTSHGSTSISTGVRRAKWRHQISVDSDTDALPSPQHFEGCPRMERHVTLLCKHEGCKLNCGCNCIRLYWECGVLALSS